MKVYISYSREDAPFVKRLAEDLRHADLSVWIDQEEIAPGERWTECIRRAIVESQNILVVISSSSTKSQWLSTEIAIAVAAQRSDSRKVIIPILADKKAELPFFLRPFQALDLSTSSKYEYALPRLIRALKNLDRKAADVALLDKEQFDLIDIQYKALANEIKEHEETLRSHAIFILARLAAAAATFATGIAIAFTLIGSGLLGKLLQSPIATLIIGVLSGLAAPLAVRKLTEVLKNIFQTSEEVKQ